MTLPLGLLFHDISRLLRAEFERRARDSRLTLLQWRTLGAVAREEGLTQSVLAARLEVSPMTMSGVLERMEVLGFVRRAGDRADRRAKRVWITESGRALAGELRAVADEVHQRALAGIAPGPLAALHEALPQIVRNLSAMADRERSERAGGPASPGSNQDRPS